MSKQKVLVIGAGASGLVSIKSCIEGGLDVACYERKGEIGGLWRYDENSTSVMKFTISNTSKEMTSFSDFPAPKDFPTYMHHNYVLKYLELYADNFGLFSKIMYNQEVVELIPAENYGSNGSWIVKVRDLQSNELREEHFDGVMICIGHHSEPYIPSYSNIDLFEGNVYHSCHYKTSEGMEDKVVLVIGAGNSGVEVATDVANVAEKVYLSTRRGAWIFPRIFEKGKPLDTCCKRRYKHFLPVKYESARIKRIINDKMNHERYGIKPFHKINSQHPTVSDELPAKLLNGSIFVKRDVKEFNQTGVIFDGDEEYTHVDAVIFATGYNIKFPFLSDDILRVGKNNKIALYKNVFPPTLSHHTLSVIGLVQGNGSLFPLFEIQARWFVALLNGKCELPPTDKMLFHVKSEDGVRARTYVQSPRHAQEVYWIQYLDSVASEFGAKPNILAMLVTDPKLFRVCFFGPCLPYQYRLTGPSRWDGARDAILTYKDRLFGHMKHEKL